MDRLIKGRIIVAMVGALVLALSGFADEPTPVKVIVADTVSQAKVPRIGFNVCQNPIDDKSTLLENCLNPNPGLEAGTVCRHLFVAGPDDARTPEPATKAHRQRRRFVPRCCRRHARDRAELHALRLSSVNPHTAGTLEAALLDTAVHADDLSRPSLPVPIAERSARLHGSGHRHHHVGQPGKGYGASAFNTASCIIADGKVLLDHGRPNSLSIVRANPGKFELLGEGKIAPGNGRSSTPTLAEGHLFIRGAEALVCYDLKAQAQ